MAEECRVFKVADAVVTQTHRPRIANEQRIVKVGEIYLRKVIFRCLRSGRYGCRLRRGFRFARARRCAVGGGRDVGRGRRHIGDFRSRGFCRYEFYPGRVGRVGPGSRYGSIGAIPEAVRLAEGYHRKRQAYDEPRDKEYKCNEWSCFFHHYLTLVRNFRT